MSKCKVNNVISRISSIAATTAFQNLNIPYQDIHMDCVPRKTKSIWLFGPIRTVTGGLAVSRFRAWTSSEQVCALSWTHLYQPRRRAVFPPPLPPTARGTSSTSALCMSIAYRLVQSHSSFAYFLTLYHETYKVLGETHLRQANPSIILTRFQR